MPSHITIDGPDSYLFVDEDPAEVQSRIASAGEGLVELTAQATQTTDAGTIWVNPDRIVSVRQR